MSWFLTGLLKSDEKEEDQNQDDDGADGWDDSELFSPGKGMKDDLSELGKNLTQHLWGVASFLAPPPAPKHDHLQSDISHREAEEPQDIEEGMIAKTHTTEHEDPRVASGSSQSQNVDDASTSGSEGTPAQILTGFRNDLAELKGGFAKGLSRLSSAAIRVVSGDESSSDNLRAENAKKQGRSGLNALFKPLIGNVLLSNERRIDDAEEHDDALASNDSSDGQEASPSRLRLPARLASHIDEISKLASSIFPFVHEDEAEEILEAPGVTDEVVAFARNISMHPETWLDFPLVSDDEYPDDFKMNSFQKEHVYAVEHVAPSLSALKVELCPQHMNEGRFWRIYFVLLHSRLSEMDAALLSTSQVLETRKILVEELREEKSGQKQLKLETNKLEPHDANPSHAPSSAEADEPGVVDKDTIASTVKLAPQSVEETEADEWLESEAAVEAENADGDKVGRDGDDVSFSDLEDEDDRSQQVVTTEPKARGWVQLNNSPVSEEDKSTEAKKHERVGSNDWLTVDEEDVGSGGSP